MAELRPEARTVAIPLSPDDWVMLSGVFPTTPERWEQLLRTLEAMRPGLVSLEDESERLRAAIESALEDYDRRDEISAVDTLRAALLSR